jgi:TrmH family RNA methyltransferase
VPPTIVLDGFHAWKHAVRFGADIICARTDDAEGLSTLVGSLAPDLFEAAARIDVVGTEQLEAECRSHGIARPHHSRVLGLATAPIDGGLTGRGRVPTVLVDRPRNPGNLGAVVRVAAAAGASGVLSTGTLDPWHRDVVRAAAGLHWAVGVAHVADGGEGEVPGPVVILDPDGDDLRDVEVPSGALLVVGAERAGISPVWRERAEVVAALPMRPGVSSLNLATTVSAALYHLVMRG